MKTLGIVLLGAALIASAVLVIMRFDSSSVAGFDECVAAKNIVTSDIPRQCVTPDGRVFVEGVETLGATTQTEVNVYFSIRPESVSRPAFTEPVTRRAGSSDRARFVLDEIIKGPTEAEREQGFYSALELTGESTCGGPDYLLNIDEMTRVAEVTWCKTQILRQNADEERIQAMLVRSLSELPEVASVLIK